MTDIFDRFSNLCVFFLFFFFLSKNNFFFMEIYIGIFIWAYRVTGVIAPYWPIVSFLKKKKMIIFIFLDLIARES